MKDFRRLARIRLFTIVIHTTAVLIVLRAKQKPLRNLQDSQRELNCEILSSAANTLWLPP